MNKLLFSVYFVLVVATASGSLFDRFSSGVKKNPDSPNAAKYLNALFEVNGHKVNFE